MDGAGRKVLDRSKRGNRRGARCDPGGCNLDDRGSPSLTARYQTVFRPDRGRGYVRRSHTGRGLARRLLESVHRLSDADHGAAGGSLTAEAVHNLPFHEQFGYKRVGHAVVGDGLETWVFLRGAKAVDEFLAAARQVPVTQWNQPRMPGKWSPGQVAEHLALAYEVNRRVVNGSFPGNGAPRLLRPLLRTFLLKPVLKRGSFIPGSKSPKVFRPAASAPQQAPLLGRLQIAVKAFEADAAASASDVIEHPIFGRLQLSDFVRLQEIHTRHHRKQVAAPPQDHSPLDGGPS